ACYRRALRRNPRYALAHNNLGIALLRLGRPAEAAAHFRSALRLDPDLSNAKQGLQSALTAMKQSAP
ncbi:MAG: tetratricopeptide repeat protein, partial [Planctomycetota bacterium]